MSSDTHAVNGHDNDVDAPLGAEHEPPVKTGAELIQRVPLPTSVGAFVLSDDEIRRSWRVSSALAASKMFKDAQQAEVAFAKVLLGRDLGISPTQALMGIDIVKGNVQLRGVLLLAFVRKSRTYDYRIVELDGETEIESSDLTERESKQKCTLRFFEVLPDGSKEPLVPDITYTMAMARKTGNVKDGSAWYSARRNMLLWRAASDGVKFHCPDLLGGIPIYTEADDLARQDPDVGGGEPAGVDLGPRVDAVLERAAQLGHAGLADRGTAEIALRDQPPRIIDEWVKAANTELDRLGDITDAEIVEPASAALRAAAPDVEALAGELHELTEAEALARAQGDEEAADELLAQADALEAHIAAVSNPNQGQLL